VADSDIAWLSATELVAAYQQRSLSPVEVTETMLERIDTFNPLLNAFTDITPDRARTAAKDAEAAYANGSAGPMAGVPITIKDVAFTAGIRTARGSKIYADDVPDFDSPVVSRQLDAGAVMLGKTTTPEFGWKGETTSPLSGSTRNPWNLERTPGGSSGGAAACVAAGIGPIGHGSDGAGSIRIPASFSGVFGIKPTLGLVPVYPASAICDLAVHGPLTRTVADAALFLNVTAGTDTHDRTSWTSGIDYLAALRNLDLRGLCVAWSSDLGFAPIEPEVAALATSAANVFSDLGCKVVDAHPDLPDPWPIEHTLWSAAMAGSRLHDFAQVREIMDPGLVAIIDEAQGMSAAMVGRARIDLSTYASAWAQFMDGFDLVLTPTLPCTAFPVGQDQPGSVNGVPTSYLGWTAFTYPFNLAGLPAATVPCGFDVEGLPVGLQIVGKLKQDDLVLRAAAAFEAARPWKAFRPAITG